MKKFSKVKALIIVLLCLATAVSAFGAAKNTLPAYAYTDEEKEAVKAWLAANGYPPTMAGAEQAYQDYLDGKFGPIGGNDTPPETPPEPEEGADVPKTETGAGAQQEAPADASEGEQQEAAAADKENEPKAAKDEKAAADSKAEAQKPDDAKPKEAVAEKKETGGSASGKESGKGHAAVEDKSQKETDLLADADSPVSDQAAVDAVGQNAEEQDAEAQDAAEQTAQGKTISPVMLWVAVFVCAVAVCLFIAFFRVRRRS